MNHRWISLLLACGLSGLLAQSCAGGGRGGGFHGSDEGSNPVNSKEVIMYKQALIRCHKTGGTRIVKINGTLRCF